MWIKAQLQKSEHFDKAQCLDATQPRVCQYASSGHHLVMPLLVREHLNHEHSFIINYVVQCSVWTNVTSNKAAQDMSYKSLFKQVISLLNMINLDWFEVHSFQQHTCKKAKT